jgi:hypothetical protein
MDVNKVKLWFAFLMIVTVVPSALSLQSSGQHLALKPPFISRRLHVKLNVRHRVEPRDDDDDELHLGRRRNEFAEIAEFAKVMSPEAVQQVKDDSERSRAQRLSIEMKKMKAAAEAAKRRKGDLGSHEDKDNSITRVDDDAKTRTWSL